MFFQDPPSADWAWPIPHAPRFCILATWAIWSMASGAFGFVKCRRILGAQRSDQHEKYSENRDKEAYDADDTDRRALHFLPPYGAC